MKKEKKLRKEKEGGREVKKEKGRERTGKRWEMKGQKVGGKKKNGEKGRKKGIKK